jgi:hypothetical protein
MFVTKGQWIAEWPVHSTLACEIQVFAKVFAGVSLETGANTSVVFQRRETNLREHRSSMPSRAAEKLLGEGRWFY